MTIHKLVSVVVFGAAQEGNRADYKAMSYELGKLIAEAGFTFVNGGGMGLMGESSRGAKEAGGKVIGVNLHGHDHNPYSDENIDKIGIHARQSFLFSKGDAFIGLPGGTGTMYELLEIVELKKLKEDKSEPVIVLNYDGYYDAFKAQLEKMREREYFVQALSQYIMFVDTPEEAINIIKSFYGLYK